MAFLSLYIFLNLFSVARSQTSATIWEPTETYSGQDWDSTTNSDIVTDTTNCANSPCWRISGKGGYLYLVLSTESYKTIELQFSLNADLQNTEACQVKYRYADDRVNLVNAAYTTIAEFNSQTIATKIELPSTADNAYIGIQFSNTGGQDKDSCYFDDLSVYGIQITPAPTEAKTSSQTPSPTTPTTPNAPSTPTAKSPTTPTRGPSSYYYDSIYGGSSGTNQGIQKQEFSPFNSVGSFFAFIGGIAAIGCMCGAPIWFIYIMIKSCCVDAYGINTKGVVTRKWVRRRRSKRRTHYTYMIEYRYCGPDSREYIDEKGVYNTHEWQTMNVGSHIDIKYLAMNPRCNRKALYGGYCCTVFIIFSYGLIAIVTAGMGWFMYISFCSNGMVMFIWTLFFAIFVCAIPLNFCTVRKEFAKPIKSNGSHVNSTSL